MLNKKEYMKKWRRDNREHIRHYQYEYLRKNPWIRTLGSIRTRCSPNQSYGCKGRKNFLTKEDIKFLWFRDKAWLLDRLSIDRKDNDGNYTLENCEFIEYKINSLKGAKLGGIAKAKKYYSKVHPDHKKCGNCGEIK